MRLCWPWVGFADVGWQGRCCTGRNSPFWLLYKSSEKGKGKFPSSHYHSRYLTYHAGTWLYAIIHNHTQPYNTNTTIHSHTMPTQLYTAIEYQHNHTLPYNTNTTIQSYNTNTTIPSHTVPTLPCAAIRYHALPCSTMRYHALPCATMRYHALSYTTNTTCMQPSTYTYYRVAR